MQKAKRLLAIEQIITEENISSQYLLLKKLRAKGISCTQATLSRNLRQLGAGRIADGRGGYKYAISENPGVKVPVTANIQLLPVIREIVDAKGLIVIRTLPGNASNTAFYIDSTSRYEIAGTIAGDDTILVIPRDGISNSQVHTCLEIILPGLHEQVGKSRPGYMNR
jgi:transcriptional regulator of arginine metabolism